MRTIPHETRCENAECQYLMVCISAAILRVRGDDSETSETPFRLPLGPATPVVAAILCVILLAQQSLFEILATVAALAVGLALYFLSRGRSLRSGE